MIARWGKLPSQNFHQIQVIMKLAKVMTVMIVRDVLAAKGTRTPVISAHQRSKVTNQDRWLFNITLNPHINL